MVFGLGEIPMCDAFYHPLVFGILSQGCLNISIWLRVDWHPLQKLHRGLSFGVRCAVINGENQLHIHLWIFWLRWRFRIATNHLSSWCYSQRENCDNEWRCLAPSFRPSMTGEELDELCETVEVLGHFLSTFSVTVSSFTSHLFAAEFPFCLSFFCVKLRKSAPCDSGQEAGGLIRWVETTMLCWSVICLPVPGLSQSGQGPSSTRCGRMGSLRPIQYAWRGTGRCPGTRTSQWWQGYGKRRWKGLG